MIIKIKKHMRLGKFIKAYCLSQVSINHTFSLNTVDIRIELIYFMTIHFDIQVQYTFIYINTLRKLRS